MSDPLLRCPECGGTLTLIPGSEGRVKVPSAVTHHVLGDSIPRVTIVTRFLSCNSCEFCWR